jgi:hypothetical protein
MMGFDGRLLFGGASCPAKALEPQLTVAWAAGAQGHNNMSSLLHSSKYIYIHTHTYVFTVISRGETKKEKEGRRGSVLRAGAP